MVLVIGANPTDAHPVFASRLKKRLREGAQLIVADPRRIDLVKSPHVETEHHLKLLPGTNVAFINAMAHVIVTENLHAQSYIKERCELEAFERWKSCISEHRNSPEAMADVTGIPADQLRAAARLFARANIGAIYYGWGVTEHSQGSTIGIATHKKR